MNQIAKTQEPPYYAVVFTSVRTATDEGSADTAEKMIALASSQPGFLGVESVGKKAAWELPYRIGRIAIQFASGKTTPRISRLNNSAAINGTAAIAFEWQKSIENMVIKLPCVVLTSKQTGLRSHDI